jgi:hypothetical protein
MTKIIIPILLTALLSCIAPKNSIPQNTNTPVQIYTNNPQFIRLKNPSFEDEPQASHTPYNWFDCGFQGESPPDVQPNPTYKVVQKAFHGKTYLGLVIRDIGTYESIGQKLNLVLSKDTCYSFSAYLMRSNIYESMSQATRRMTNYSKPCVLRIWASDSLCTRKELLALTHPIHNTKWIKYSFTFAPQQNWHCIKFEAYFGDKKAYNGNLLIDNLSDITPCPCAKSEK